MFAVLYYGILTLVNCGVAVYAQRQDRAGISLLVMLLAVFCYIQMIAATIDVWKQ